MWSFVGNKSNKQWIGLAVDVETREIVGVYVGHRSRDGAQGLWDALPAVYRQCAVSYTDFWSAYNEVFPSKRHHSVGKESGKTSYIEPLSFSKKVENHLGAIWYFIHHSMHPYLSRTTIV
jgi:insertion element IS1 protein InsB